MAWVKGQSGNPKGRPRTGIFLTERLRASVTPEQFDELVADLILKARDGHPTAMGIVWDRIAPVPKHERAAIKFKVGDTSAETITGILKGVVAGEIAVGDAKTLSDIVSAQASLEQLKDIEDRLKQIELSRNGK